MPLEILKAFAKRTLPAKHLVRAHYAFQKLRDQLEPEIALIRDFIEPGHRVVDVGANQGIYAYHCWRLGARVEVFEPNPICLSTLSAWAVGKRAITVHPVALSNREGFADLAIPVDELGVEHDASASLEHGAQGRARYERVPLRTLDSFEFDHVRLIKIDVEGHEAAVIAGRG